MKRVELSKLGPLLVEFIRGLGDEPVALTENGRPAAVLLPVGDADFETMSMSVSPQFNAILLRSAERYAREGGLSDAEVRRRLGTRPKNGVPAAGQPVAKSERSRATHRPGGKK